MDVVIKSLFKRDWSKARKFAIDGMHLTWYTSNRLELYLYSKYFWYLEITRATLALGAYMDNKLVGVILADIDNAPKVTKSLWCRAFVKLGALIINLIYKDASGTYDSANRKMLENYRTENKVDGELNFFAVDPVMTGKGIGTLLLDELERKERGKQIYLFTDSGSTYQFYAHRGFNEVGRQEITLRIDGNDVPLTCLLFAKRLGEQAI